MSQVELLTRAIERLETLKAESFPGDWEVLTSGVEGGDHWYVMAEHESILSVSANDGSDEDFRRPTASLVVTLHRTIDAQLAILRNALGRATSKISMGGGAEAVWSTERDAVALASAIVGDAS